MAIFTVQLRGSDQYREGCASAPTPARDPTATRAERLKLNLPPTRMTMKFLPRQYGQIFYANTHFLT